ncbi:MAG: hypothetical protein FWC10_00395 [Lentimicrobiaceae bacterium]|nr:hypothetical protein [Lentimicrobiaceae bacterium]
MKNNDFLKNLHIGKMVCEIAHQKEVSSKKIAETILRYERNSHKIFQLHDMDVEDIVHISYLLEYNILEDISKNYLSQLPYKKNIWNHNAHIIEYDVEKNFFQILNHDNSCFFLKHVQLGEHIKSVAETNGWNEHGLAKKLNCSQSYISYLFHQKSLKIKHLIWISIALNHNFIAAQYLVHMFNFSLSILQYYTFTENILQIKIIK